MTEDENKLHAVALALIEPEAQDETIVMIRGIAPWAETLSDDAIMVCVAFVELKGDHAKIYEIMGYDISRQKCLVRSRLAQRLIGEIARLDLVGTGIMIAIQTYKEVATSASASPAARVKAADSLAALSNLEEHRRPTAKGQGGKDLNTMTLAELQDFAAQMTENVTMIEGMQDAIDLDAETLPQP